MKELGISNVDVVIISMADNFEASVMATMLCKEAGIKKVIVKCSNDAHCNILKKLGADETVLPERDAGIRLAKNLLSAGFIDIADLSDDRAILEMEIKPEWLGKTLKELDLRRKYNINVMAFKRNGRIDTVVNPDDVIKADENMIVLANRNEIKKIK